MESDDSMMSIPSGEIVPLNQLKFRKPFLFYLKTNAKPRLLLKLMQISRYFCFREFPCMVVYDLTYDDDQWEHSINPEEPNQTLDLDNLTKPLWISDELYLLEVDNTNLLSQLLSKTAVCDIKYLNIFEQHIKMNEFQILISSNAVERVTFHKTKIVYDDGSVVPVDEIFKLLPNLKRFDWTFTDTNAASEITPTSTSKLIEYLNPSNLKQLNFRNIPETFDFELFTEFMDKNPSLFFRLHFYIQLPDDYERILQDYVDKFIQTGEYKNRRIWISFPKLTRNVYKILYKNYCNHLPYLGLDNDSVPVLPKIEKII